MPRVSRRQTIKLVGAATTAGMGGLAGCIGDGITGGGGGGASSFNVGIFAPYTGPFAPWGNALTTGSELAKQDLEEEFDVSIELNQYDTETNPSAALERMKRAVTSDGIDFAHGGISSAVSGSIGSWASDNGVPYITQGASDTLTGADCKEYMFRAYPSNTMMARAAAQPMADEADQWYLLYSDYIWGQTAQEVIGSVLEENGSTVVGKDAVPFPADDFTQYINNVANSDATAVAMIVPGLDARLAAEQLMNRGLHTELSVMFHQFEDLVLWGLTKEAASMMDIGPTGWSNAVDGTDQFNQRVADAGDTDPFARHFMAYVSLDQLVRAAVRAGSKDPEAVRGELEEHEIGGPVADLQSGGSMTWRACDHQLVQPTHVVSARDTGSMTDEPYKQWFDVAGTVAGEDVVILYTGHGEGTAAAFERTSSSRRWGPDHPGNCTPASVRRR